MERSRLQSFLRSAETLQIYGLCDYGPQAKVDKQALDNEDTENAIKKTKKIRNRNQASVAKNSVTTTITPLNSLATTPSFTPLRPSSRNSPKAGPSNRPLESPIAVKIEEPNFSDEENHPEHVVIPSDPNSIGE